MQILSFSFYGMESFINPGWFCDGLVCKYQDWAENWNIFLRIVADEFWYKETRCSYFCVTPKNQALHKPASFFVK